MFGTFKLVMVGILVSSLAGAGLYVMKLRSDNAILKVNQIKLEEAVGKIFRIVAEKSPAIRMVENNAHEKRITAQIDFTLKAV